MTLAYFRIMVTQIMYKMANRGRALLQTLDRLAVSERDLMCHVYVFNCQL